MPDVLRFRTNRDVFCFLSFSCEAERVKLFWGRLVYPILRSLPIVSFGSGMSSLIRTVLRREESPEAKVLSRSSEILVSRS